MRNKRLKQLVFSFVVAGLILMMSGCSGQTGENKEAFKLYNKVQLGDTKDELDKDLGQAQEVAEGTYNYLDSETGFGVTVVFDSANAATMKTIFNEDEDKILALSDAQVSEEQLDSIKVGMSYEEVEELLGTEGVEIVQMTNPSDMEKPIHIMIWFNQDGTGIYVSFFGEKGKVLGVDYWSGQQ